MKYSPIPAPTPDGAVEAAASWGAYGDRETPMTIGHRRLPWKRLAGGPILLASLAWVAGAGSGAQDTLLLRHDDPARGVAGDDAAGDDRPAPPKFDLTRLTVRLTELEGGGPPEPMLEIHVETLPWSGEIETGARIQVWLAAGADPPLELTLRYQEPRTARRTPVGGVARLSGSPRLAALSPVSPGGGVVFRLPVADLPAGAALTEGGMELRLWAVAVQGGGEDRLPDTDDGGPPDTEAEVLRVRVPASR